MNAIRVITNSKVSQVSSRTPSVRSDSNLTDFFIGDKMNSNQAQKRYSQSEKGKAAHRKAKKRYQQGEKFKAVRKRYRQSEKYKATQERYQQSEKGKNIYKANARLYRLRHPEREKAYIAVSNAIRRGNLPRPDALQCHYCPAQAKEYHHWRGYMPVCRLDVLPVCIKCHKNIHKKIA